MCLAKTVVCCPKCKTPQQVTKPDSHRQFWSTERPEEAEEIVDSVEQILDCKNSGCHEKFSIYWYGK